MTPFARSHDFGSHKFLSETLVKQGTSLHQAHSLPLIGTLLTTIVRDSVDVRQLLRSVMLAQLVDTVRAAHLSPTTLNVNL